MYRRLRESEREVKEEERPRVGGIINAISGVIELPRPARTCNYRRAAYLPGAKHVPTRPSSLRVPPIFFSCPFVFADSCLESLHRLSRLPLRDFGINVKRDRQQGVVITNIV